MASANQSCCLCWSWDTSLPARWQIFMVFRPTFVSVSFLLMHVNFFQTFSCIATFLFLWQQGANWPDLTPLKTIVISTKDGCPTLLAYDGYFGQACTLFYFYSCLFCKLKLIKGANKVVIVVLVVAKVWFLFNECELQRFSLHVLNFTCFHGRNIWCKKCVNC